jgi:hypothetical protein
LFFKWIARQIHFWSSISKTWSQNKSCSKLSDLQLCQTKQIQNLNKFWSKDLKLILNQNSIYAKLVALFGLGSTRVRVLVLMGVW